MTKQDNPTPIDMRALDECICGHNREVHEDRKIECESCGCSTFSKTVYQFSDDAK